MPEAGVVFAQEFIQKVNHLFHNRSSLRLSIIQSSFRFHCGHAGLSALVRCGYLPPRSMPKLS